MNLLGLSLVLRPRHRLRPELVSSAAAAPVDPVIGLLDTWGAAAVAPPHRSLQRVAAVPDGSVGAVREFVLSFDVLRHVGIGVLADGDRASVGTTVVQRLPGRGPGVLAPCRVVQVVDTGDEVGFTYAALPGHPFVGEEVFHVRSRPDGGVECRIASVSRPVAAPARLARPVTDRVQTRIATRYLDGMVAAASRTG